MVWPGFPKRLQSALKALCCLAESGNGMQSQEIAERIRVSKAETAKILQLLVWGGIRHLATRHQGRLSPCRGGRSDHDGQGD